MPLSPMMTTSEASEIWGVAQGVARDYCRKHRNEIGAEKRGGKWLIPMNAVPPITVGKLREFCRAYLIERDNPSEAFPWVNENLYFKSLEASGLARSRDPESPICLANCVLTAAGIQFAFGETHKKGNRFIAVEFSLVSIGPSVISASVLTL